MDRMTSLADGGQPLPLAAPVLEQWTLSGAVTAAGMGALHWPNSMGLPLTEAILPAPLPIILSNLPPTESPVWLHPSRSLSKLIASDPF